MKKCYIILMLCPLTSCIATQQKATQTTQNPRVIIDNPSYMEDSPSSNTERNSENRKRVITTENNSSPKRIYSSSNEKINLLMDTAYSYLGTPYRAAGTTRAGMDCSGLVSTAYKSIDIKLSRSSSDMAKQGIDIPLSEVSIGDLLFFKTSRKNIINHVGIVTEIGKEVKFIHSSTSKGVIVSNLSEPYWKKAYIKAKRVIDM